MKSSMRISILFLLVCVFFNGHVFAQNGSGSNEPRVTSKFIGDDLLMVLDQISSDTGTNIMHANYVQGIVSCDLENVPLSKALEMVLAGTPYIFKKRDGYYVITEPPFSERELKISGDIGIANVKIQGLPGDIFTDTNGYYAASVRPGFSGKIQPVKEGYIFNPSFVIYNNIDSDRKRQNYKAEIISLSEPPQKEKKEPVVSNEYVFEDLQMALDDLAMFSGINIIYEDTVSGATTCRLNSVPLSKALEIIFSPTKYVVKKMDGYYLVTSTRMDDIKNHADKQKTVIIGSLELPLSSIINLPCNIIAEPDGSYSIIVPSGLRGKILPSKDDDAIAKLKQMYPNLNADNTNQDYTINNSDINEPLVTDTYIDDDLCLVLEVIADNTGVNIMYPANVLGSVTCKLNDTPLSKALEIILAATPYYAKKMDDYYLIYSNDFPMEKFSSNKIPGDETEPKVAYTFYEDDLLMVFEQLFYDTGINIMYNEYAQGVVTCEFEDMPLSKALEMILAPTHCVAKKRDGYYVITEYLPQDEQYEISGNVGIANVKMQGLPGEVYSDENGYYHANVKPGFSGRVEPVVDGHNFNPSYIVYNNIKSNRNKQNYQSNIIFSSQSEQKVQDEPVISEYFMGDDLWDVLNILKESTGTNIIYDGTVYSIVTCNLDKVPLGKALEIILSATPYIIKKMDTYYLIISPELDDIKNRATLGRMNNSENPNTVGYYGLSGMIKPSEENSMDTKDTMSEDDIASYEPKKELLTISDTIVIRDVPFADVIVTANPGDIKTVTDSNGKYSIEVPYGWSGKITFSKPGFKFTPDSISYENVTTDIINGVPVP